MIRLKNPRDAEARQAIIDDFYSVVNDRKVKIVD